MMAWTSPTVPVAPTPGGPVLFNYPFADHLRRLRKLTEGIVTITYMPILHEGTDAACGEVAFYLRGIPMGRALDAQDAYTFDGDVPVQMVHAGETVTCLSCGKRVGLVTIERMLRAVPADPETGEDLPAGEVVPIGVSTTSGALVMSDAMADPDAEAHDSAEGDHVGG